ncbi:aquaporin [Fulvivirgaceae bacterium BMA10]|uniref:Aquaporin n=1 Tax=Splendidivirga corallicola TaxID=3051826 RepID=A0ABT8KTS0_9BACT|nr:aquaporin [Fulvivirgaceae bacterium BMA10]
MKNYLVELVGTFFLVLVIGLTVIDPGAGAMAALAIGSTLMIMVYAGGPISGGHYNPAVTLAVWMRGKCDAKDVAPYMISQVIGASLAAFAVDYLKGGPEVAAGTIEIGPAILNELLFTFALCFVVLNVATSNKSAGNSYFGLAIGFTVCVGAYAGGAISGGAYNPAVATGISLMGLSSWANIWVFLVGNFAGGILAALLYKAVNPDEYGGVTE